MSRDAVIRLGRCDAPAGNSEKRQLLSLLWTCSRAPASPNVSQIKHLLPFQLELFP